jgi:hypothetical protein
VVRHDHAVRAEADSTLGVVGDDERTVPVLRIQAKSSQSSPGRIIRYCVRSDDTAA